MKKLEKMHRKLENKISDVIENSFRETFGIEIEDGYDIFRMTRYAIRADKKKLTKEQRAFIAGFYMGYYSAADLVFFESQDLG